MTIADQYTRLKRQAAAYATRYGVEDTTPTVKRPTRATLERIKKEYERMKGQVWARGVRKRYEEKEQERQKILIQSRTSIPIEEKEETTPEEEWPAPEEFPGAEEIDTTTAESLRDYCQSLYDELITYYGERAGEWPIEQNLELLIGELDNIIDNGIEEALDSINSNTDIIEHLIEQATNYRKSEKRGAEYYVSFFGQIEGLLHGTSWVAVDAAGLY